MKKVMISQPMGGKSPAEIAKVKARITEILESIGYQVVNTLFLFDDDKLAERGVENISLYYLAESLKKMSECDVVFFADGWENARGCRIEHTAARAYGIPTMSENDLYV